MSLLLLQAQTTIDVGPWVNGAKGQVETIISQGGPFLFLLFGTLVGVSILMALVRKIVG